MGAGLQGKFNKEFEKKSKPAENHPWKLKINAAKIPCFLSTVSTNLKC